MSHLDPPTPEAAAKAQAFAAQEAIEAGLWDDNLARLLTAIYRRQHQSAYKEHILARAEIRAKKSRGQAE